ncbi:MAG: (d)CMP kinase [Terriglobia bacterium]
MRTQGIVIAIDGPVGTGKSTVARRVAERLGYLYVDSGSMYRVVACCAEEQGIAPSDVSRLVAMVRRLRIHLEPAPAGVRVSVNGRELTEKIRAPGISQAASVVSTVPEVRRLLVAQQQQLGAAGGVVMEGRDIATVVFPDAELKFFLDASSEVRAQRRFEQQQALGIPASLEQTREEVHQRDRRDAEREASPLRRASDAVYLDTTALSADEIVEVIVRLARQRQESAPGASVRQEPR